MTVYKAAEPQKNRKKYLAIAVVCLALVSTFAAIAIYASKKTPEPVSKTDTPKQEQVKEEPKPYTSLEGRYLFNGTIVLARAVELYAVDAQGDPDYAQPFSQFDSFQPELYDAQAADFECPITDNLVSYWDSVNTLMFNCRPEFLPAMTEYITLYNLANNHSDNRGPDGIPETRENLDEYADKGVQYFGHYDPTITDDICEVIGLPVRLQALNGAEESAQLPIAFCTWHFFNYGDRQPTEEELAVATSYAEHMPVFAFVEMGPEYRATATDKQRQTARRIIDAGAEFVFANNPHWVQDSEEYKGKLIVYSLGNFIFDQLEPETRQGVSIDTTLSLDYTETVASWLVLSESCRPATFKDSCLEDAKKANLPKLNVQLDYLPVANINGYRDVTRKADAATQAAVEERLNWVQTMAELEAASE